MQLLIIGAGGHGSEVHSYILDLAKQQNIDLLGFIDDGLSPKPFLTTKILGDLDSLKDLAAQKTNETIHYITAFGSNPTRKQIISKIEALHCHNLRPWTLR